MLSNFSNQYGIYLLFELSFIPPYPHPLKEYGIILSNKGIFSDFFSRSSSDQRRNLF